MGSVKIENFEIEGKSCPLFDNTQVLFYPSKLKGKNCMEGLVQHLWINSSKEHAGRIQTLISGQDSGLLISKRDAETCRKQLFELINLFFDGLDRPLPFFPNSSFTWLLKKRMSNAKAKKENSKVLYHMRKQIGKKRRLEKEVSSPINYVFLPILGIKRRRLR